MMPLLLCALVTQSDLVSTPDHYVSESEYLINGIEELAHLKCPICKDVDCLSKGYFFRCSSCINYFSYEDIIEANKEV